MYYSSEVTYLSTNHEGTINVTAFGSGITKEDANFDAQKNAFYVLLFRGFPGTEFSLPLIENENEARKINNDYLKNLLEKGYCTTFIMSNNGISNPFQNNNKLWVVNLEIKINHLALRKDLEQNNIIRKFGY